MSELREYIIEFLKVIGDQTRLDIMDLLKDGEKSSAEIQNSLMKAQSTISQHLKNLTNSNLIEVKKKTVKLTVDDPKNPGNTMDVNKEIKYYTIKNQDFFNLYKVIASFVLDNNRAKILEGIEDLDRRKIMKEIEDIDRKDVLRDLIK